MSEYALELQGINKRYENFQLRDVTFAVPTGSIMGFIGENGAGKTTTIKIILNMISKESGSVKIFGQDHLECEREVKKKIGYVADEEYFYSSGTLAYHAQGYSRLYDEWDWDLYRKYIREWGLDENKRISQFSKGMKTRAMLAVTLARRPSLLVMDEPTAGLDPVARIEMLDVLRDFVADGEKSVLFSTHITSDLDKIADYLTLLIDGTVKECMALDEMESKYAVISGGADSFSEDPARKSRLIGVRKGSAVCEGLIFRKDLEYFPDVNVHVPNLENLLTFYIWGEKNRR